MFCENCGSEIAENLRFCERCGKNYEDSIMTMFGREIAEYE